MNIDKILGRYTSEDRSVIFLFLDKLAKKTRRRGEISDSRKEKIITSFDEFDADIVITSLNAYLKMDIPSSKGGKGKNERYVRGIMVNKQAEKDAKAGGGVGGNQEHTGSSTGKRTPGMGEDEGARLQQLAGSARGGQLECDF